MARTAGTAKGGRKQEGDSISSFFRQAFTEHPEWLNVKSNDEVFALWLKEHPDVTEVPKNVRQSAANIKTIFRKRHKAEAKEARRAARAGNGAAPRAGKPAPASQLEQLELHIDECITFAKNLDRDALDGVIRRLRDARNDVVVMGSR
jgi:hypothetical protein